ncbi:SAM-dependent methyltransferase [Pelomonas saccharophila]|uniref:SAM-dependent methyltransferase n=1 Tax=Roseateles saccharophilus TaxID=304 RepID=A0ABU1YSQ6_ROSSA|nr:methyltransferase domain-containing protein [Roseateles saccharophilus]MDR7271876.1 SAM-dependent methyltransferase [Roseateles saccharophilus]
MTNTLDAHVEAYSGKNLYDFDNEILLNWYPQRIALHSAGARSLLELGLGHGFSTDNFSRLFDRHLVLEGSGAVIENFQRRFPACRAEVVETYFENFDTDERFDVIVMGFILEHVDDPRLIIERYKHLLAPGGRMFIAVPNAAVMNRRLGHLAGLLPDMEALSENDLLLGHKRYYTVETLSADVEQVGCQVDRLEGIYLKPLTTRQMVSLNLSPDLIQSLCRLGVDYPELSCGILAEISAGKAAA